MSLRLRLRDVERERARLLDRLVWNERDGRPRDVVTRRKLGEVEAVRRALVARRVNDEGMVK